MTLFPQLKMDDGTVVRENDMVSVLLDGDRHGEIVGRVSGLWFNEEDGECEQIEVRTSKRAGRPVVILVDDILDVEVLPGAVL